MENKDTVQIDALIPDDMAAKAEQIGIKKARMNIVNTFVLAVLAGAFIALGAVFATTVVAGSSEFLSYGVKQLLAGLVFSLGLILVLVGGAELFTGNTMLIMAWTDKRVNTALIVKNWGVVYLGNLIGALSTMILVFVSQQFTFGNGAVGAAALATANAKVNLGFIQAIALGILCNSLVCLAIWLTFSARTSTDRILCILPPIAAFVAAGFEHSIANMFFIPRGILIKLMAPAAFWESIGQVPADYVNLTWGNFVFANLLPVTLGNIIGGGGMAAAVYWFVYLHNKAK